jgi:hypothetical protein
MLSLLENPLRPPHLGESQRSCQEPLYEDAAKKT